MAEQESSAQPDSEEMMIKRLQQLADAGASIIQVRTREPLRAVASLRKHLTLDDNYVYHEWDVIRGLRSGWKSTNYPDDFAVTGDSEDFYTAFQKPLDEMDKKPNLRIRGAGNDKDYVYLYLDPHLEFMHPTVVELAQKYSALLPQSPITIILVTPDVPLPVAPGTILVTEMTTPSHEELRNHLDKIVESSVADFPEGIELDDDERDQIAAMGLGMSKFEFETHGFITVVEAGARGQDYVDFDDFMKGIAIGKTEVVRQTDILELFPTEDMANIGGMQRMKDWFEARKDSYSEKARQFGIKPPKGVAFVGTPGSGKSLAAKAIAHVWGVPLLRLDFGKVFAKYIGESEQRMRSVLKMVESMGRVVLMADEIDKGLGGTIGGGGDSGTGSRVLGAFLTWLQETKWDGLVVMTANRIEGLPPELFRRGRMDAIFSTGLPTDAERKEVLAVHLNKRARNIDMFEEDELALFVDQSKDYVAAEIEAAVADALVLAWNDDSASDVEMRHIVKALNTMIPMTTSHKAQIETMLDWADKNATPVAYNDKYPDPRTQESANKIISNARGRAPRTRPRREA